MTDRTSGQYFDLVPASETAPTEFKCRFEGTDFEFRADSGVFSKRKADYGSCLLLETFISERKTGLANGMEILDLGCGYGLVGIVVKRIFPAVSVTMSDINTRAVEFARANASSNLVSSANIIFSDGFENIPGSFDTVLLNPPVRAGKQTVFRLYQESYLHITDGGRIYVVIQTKQGAGSTVSELERLFGNCSVLNIKSGYRVLKSVKMH